MHEACFYEKLANNAVVCRLCPHNCSINDGQVGLCGVRKNINGSLFAKSYGVVSTIHIDPIEKKPLYHFYPGKDILSIGSFGCNLKCSFCQNWEISQYKSGNFGYYRIYTVEEIVSEASNLNTNIGIAYTYNEPTIWYEFMLDIAQEARDNNLKNVMVTNGFINEKPLKELLNYIDAFNVDLKAFSEAFYKKITKSELSPVLRTIKQISDSGRHIEITNLVIPVLNDNEDEFRKMAKWISRETGRDTVLHISRYFPNYKMLIALTGLHILDRLYDIAREYLDYVYLGNVNLEPQKSFTFCSECGSKIIERTAYVTHLLGIDEQGCCKYCGNNVVII